MIADRLIFNIKRFLHPIFKKKINGTNNSIIKKSYPNKLKIEIKGNNNCIKLRKSVI